MNIYEIAEDFSLPVGKLRRMERRGLLKTTPSDERPAKIRLALCKKQHLSVVNLIDLIKDEKNEIWKKIGHYAEIARQQVEALGDVTIDALPEARAANLIFGARILDSLSIDFLVDWLRSVIPKDGCTYHYIAVRMAANVPERRLKQSLVYLPLAIVNLKSHPSLAGWSDKVDGKTVFKQPDHYDL